MGCSGLFWSVLGCTGLISWGGHWLGDSGDPGDPGGPGGQDDQPR